MVCFSALVMRREGDDFPSVFILSDEARLKKSKTYVDGIATGLETHQILRPLLEHAKDYAQSLLGEFPKIATGLLAEYDPSDATPQAVGSLTSPAHWSQRGCVRERARAFRKQRRQRARASGPV